MLLATMKAPTNAPTCTRSETPCESRNSTVESLSIICAITGNHRS
jgi:hypothetical protein